MTQTYLDDEIVNKQYQSDFLLHPQDTICPYLTDKIKGSTMNLTTFFVHSEEY